METIFKVPDHVLLPEDVAQRTKHTAKGYKKMLKEIESIKKEIEMVFKLLYVSLTQFQFHQFKG